MRVLISIIAGVLAGLAVRTLTSPKVKEITAEAPSYQETHAATVALAEANSAATKSPPPPPLNPAYTEALQVRGYIILGTRVNVVLSDGSTWTEKTGGLEEIERSHVRFRGKTYAIRGGADSGKPDVQAALPPSPTGGQKPPALAALFDPVASASP